MNVLPEPDLGKEGPLSFMDHTEINKGWEDVGDVLVQIYFEQTPPSPCE